MHAGVKHTYLTLAARRRKETIDLHCRLIVLAAIIETRFVYCSFVVAPIMMLNETKPRGAALLLLLRMLMMVKLIIVMMIIAVLLH